MSGEKLEMSGKILSTGETPKTNLSPVIRILPNVWQGSKQFRVLLYDISLKIIKETNPGVTINHLGGGPTCRGRFKNKFIFSPRLP